MSCISSVSSIDNADWETPFSLDHFEYQLNTVLEGIAGENGERKPIRIALLAGADLIQTMSQPGKLRHQ